MSAAWQKHSTKPKAPAAEDARVLTIGVRGSGPGSGKDTVADFFAEAFRSRGLMRRRERFATPLRECVEILTGVSVAESQTTEGKARVLPEWGMTVGQMLQRLGTDAVRNNVHDRAWELALFQRFAPDDIVVISDVRFPNEEAAVRARAGVVVQVTRPDVAGDDHGLVGRDPNHASERALDGSKPDHLIVNDGTLEDLRDRVFDLADRLIGERRD